MIDQPPLYRVDRVEDYPYNYPGRGFGPGKRVYVEAFGNTTFSLDFPIEAFNATTVRQAVEKQVAHLAEVLQIQGPPLGQ